MANPEHIEELDHLDKLSVISYRLGISLFAILLLSILNTLIHQIHSGTGSLLLSHFSINLLAISAIMSAINLHVYNKKIRLFITSPTWFGIVLLLILRQETNTMIATTLVWLPVGLFFITFSGIAIKESFCFHITGLTLIPLLLCIAVFSLALTLLYVALLCVTLATLLFFVLAIKKWRMPLHFDIGDKSRYQY